MNKTGKSCVQRRGSGTTRGVQFEWGAAAGVTRQAGNKESPKWSSSGTSGGFELKCSHARPSSCLSERREKGEAGVKEQRKWDKHRLR